MVSEGTKTQSRSHHAAFAGTQQFFIKHRTAFIMFSTCVILLLLMQAALPSSSFRGGRQLQNFVQPVSVDSSPEVDAAAAAAAAVAATQRQTEQPQTLSAGHQKRTMPHWWDFLRLGDAMDSRDAVESDRVQKQDAPPQVSSAHISVRVRGSAKEGTSDQKPFYSLIVLTTSGISWRDRRDRLRKQWRRNLALIKRPAEFPVLMRFAVGTLDTSDESRAAMYKEDAEHNDVTFLQCLDMDDELNDHGNWHVEAGPSATTQKVLLGMQWAVRRFDFDYFMRLGDDSYFRVDKMIGLISNQIFSNKKIVVGQILETEVHGVRIKYAQGMGYLVSYDICEFAAHATQHLLDTAPEHKLKPEFWPLIKDNGECTA